MSKKNMLVTFLLLSFLVSCGTFLSPTKQDPVTGHFPSSILLNKNEVEQELPINLQQYNRLLVVAIKQSTNFAREDYFWKKSIKNLNVFRHIESIESLDTFLVAQGLADKVSSFNYDMTSLVKLERVYGKFLVAEISSNCESECRVKFKIIDPATGKIYFAVKREGVSFGMMDQYVYYPILNKFNDWLRNNQ